MKIDSHLATKPDGSVLIKKNDKLKGPFRKHVEGRGIPIFTYQNSIILA